MREQFARLVGLMTLGVLAGSFVTVSAPAPANAADGDGEVVVKLTTATGCGLDPLLDKYAIDVVSTVLASRNIFLVRWTDPAKWTDSKADDLAHKLMDDKICVGYAERDRAVELTDQRYHAWPDGTSVPADEQEWRDQKASWKLRLGKVGKLSRGSGIKIAVLDTGVDPTHPVIAGRVIAGWDYIDDDSDPYDEIGGTVSGHGTFIAGVVHLVAPAAQVISMRVLDSEGEGDGYVIAEAIRDAVQMGASVINLSLSTLQKIESKVVTDVIRWARKRGTLTVAAAGNDGTVTQHWPAAQGEVISVAALDAANVTIAPYSTRGGWVDCAALGTDLISVMPGGGFDAWSGTSMATPVVAAQLGLIKAANPNLDVGHVEEQLRETATKVTGYKLRYGAIDILASLQRALR